MKAVLLCDPAPNQRALAARLHAVHPLTAIGVVTLPSPAKRPSRLRRIARAVIGYSFVRVWREMMRRYGQKFPTFPEVDISEHHGVNSTSVTDLIDRVRPALVLVSGTDLLREPLIQRIARYGQVMNLHTGLSPYIKGGPNCTNWCLSLGEFGMIGNTVMWLDGGIDSGRLIATERTPLAGEESLLELHLRVMEHAHDLYCRCYARFVAGLPLPSVPQEELGQGRLFLSRDWTAARVGRALWNYYARYRPHKVGREMPVMLVRPER